MAAVVRRDQVFYDTVNAKIDGEASTMGLKPGEWPEHILLVDNNYKGFIFHRSYAIDAPNGELGGYVYTVRDGSTTLTVWND